MNSAFIPAALNFIRLMITAVSNASLYTLDHPQVKRLCDQAGVVLKQATQGKTEIAYMVVEGDVICDGQPLRGSMYLGRWAALLKAKGIEHLRLNAGATPNELFRLVEILAAKKGSGRDRPGLVNIQLGTLDMSFGGAPDVDGKSAEESLSLSAIVVQEIERLKEIYAELKTHKKLQVIGIQEIIAGLVQAMKQEAVPLMALVPLRNFDEYTFTHSINVCVLNLSQAMALEIDGEALHEIGIAALLHDVGKLFIPIHILEKPGGLDESEWALVRQHPIRGAQYLVDTPGLPRLAATTAFEHHMKFNQEGYPRVPAGWRQNLCSQMTAVSDFFDALHTNRSYRRSLDFEQIAALMAEKEGTDFHPALTRNFFKILNRMHAGSTEKNAAGS